MPRKSQLPGDALPQTTSPKGRPGKVSKPGAYPPEGVADLRLLTRPFSPREFQEVQGTYHNLPLQLTSFIGREREMVEVRRLLAVSRLLTLTGPGGCGKTWLAVEVATGLATAAHTENRLYPDGVWWVDLTSLADPALIASAIALAAGAREQPGRSSMDTLLNYLQPQRLLLILDNCEHLIEACARMVDTLLRACPYLTILATSREALNIAGEVVWVVPSLSTPGPVDLRATHDLVASLPEPHVHASDALETYDAVRLFVARATAALVQFTLTAQNGAAVVQICRKLDGIPLAIELAAARVKVLSVDQIAARLDDGFELLTRGSRTAPLRHQTLRALIDWSYNLLSESERSLLRQLSVFAGGWTLAAAESVCGGDTGLSPGNILDLLTQLVDKSLVVVEMPLYAERRYRLLETIRQYGQEKLQAAGESTLMRQRHLNFFLALAEGAEPELTGPEQAAWLDRLELDLDNFRVALAWCSDDGHTMEAGLRLATALRSFWQLRDHLDEGQAWLEQLLTRNELLSSTVAAGVGMPAEERQQAYWRAKAYRTAGRLAHLQNEYTTAYILCDKSLALCRWLEDNDEIAYALSHLGMVVLGQGDYPAAQAYFEESLAVRRILGSKLSLAIALHDLAEVLRVQGDYERALPLYDESLVLHRQLGNTYRVACVLHNLGHLRRDQGKERQAAALLEESLLLHQSLGAKTGIAGCLLGLAGLAATSLYPDGARRAARLLGAMQSLMNARGILPEEPERLLFRRDIAALHAQLDEAVFTAAWAEGQAMSVEAAIQEALSIAQSVQHPAAVSRTESRSQELEPGPPHARLTPREREVVRLIAQGKINAEIADTLVVGKRTVETHISNILSKLEFTSRVQIITWAISQGLDKPAG